MLMSESQVKLKKAHEAAALLYNVDSFDVCVRLIDSFCKRDLVTASVHGCYWVLATMPQVQWLGLNGSYT